jgi:N-methylhydantoinase B
MSAEATAIPARGEPPALDAVTFEILRHRFTAIAEEGAITLRNVSGSPTIAQSNDCNVVLMDPAGVGLVIGYTLPTHALSCMYLAQYVLREFAANPGIRPGDMFMSNHPYICTPHQTCVATVAPVFHGDALVAWAGAGIHVADVGGPTAGQVSVGARSIFDEALPMAPLKIVENGVIRKDLEGEFLVRSRTPAQNALDMRAMIAANNTIARRVLETVERYGAANVLAGQARVLDYAEAQLRAILRELPDGTWQDTHYLDYNDQGQTTFYAVRLALTKTGDELVFDFSGSSPQAPAVINCSPSALTSSVIVATLAAFGYAIGLNPGAVLRVVRIESTPGTVVHSTWPAGLSKGTTSISQTIRAVGTTCLGQLFASSPAYRRRALATCNGLGGSLQELIGTDQRGAPFAGVFQETYLSGGYGARGTRDGVNTSGLLGGPEVSISNVEHLEFYYPLLYLYRRQEADTAGAGQYRGGSGLGVCYTPHDVANIPHCTNHTLGLEVPTAVGLSGGYPGSTVRNRFKRASNVAALFARGQWPQSLAELDGALERPAGVSQSYLRAGDVFMSVGCGGGGYGDPLERDPAAVLADVVDGLTSPAWASRMYGVVVAGSPPAVDAAATRRRRQVIRRNRRARSRPPRRLLQIEAESPAASPPAPPADDPAPAAASEAEIQVACRCGQPLGRGGERRDYLRVREVPARRYAPYDSAHRRFVFREYYCPRCLLLLDLELAERD